MREREKEREREGKGRERESITKFQEERIPNEIHCVGERLSE